ncbi:hypothetical protein [Nonomuraea jiangxiensis]|nr:hypothetical protein [Nonomuraea jiangxiensis]
MVGSRPVTHGIGNGLSFPRLNIAAVVGLPARPAPADITTRM